MPRYAAALQDAQRAIGLVRHNAVKWGIDSSRIGALGFSAGAHLSAAVGNNFARRTYEAQDDADQASCRPDFMILVYPGYLTLREELTKVSPELNPSAQTPQTFIVQTQDDNVPVEGSLYYYAALKSAKVPAEMHLYAKGGHGYGLRPSTNPVSAWPKRLEEWLRAGGLLNPRK
jgi:acetyl esterase/lipase